MVEAGWYLQDDGTERFWDGAEWTDFVRAGIQPDYNRRFRIVIYVVLTWAAIWLAIYQSTR